MASRLGHDAMIAVAGSSAHVAISRSPRLRHNHRWKLFRRVMSNKSRDTIESTFVEKEIIPVKLSEKNESLEALEEKSSAEITHLWTMLRHNASPELVAIALGTALFPDWPAMSTSVYFVQGFVSLSLLAVSYFLKDELNQGPAQVAFLEGFGGIPWIIKPLYGFASDAVPLFGYRRRSYLVMCGMLSSISWFLLGTSTMTAYTTVGMLVISSVGSACSDVVVDSIVVERARGEPQETSGSLQSLCWASMALGGVVSSYYGGYFVDAFGPRFVFRTMSVFPLLVAMSAFLVKETRYQSKTPQQNEALPLLNGNSTGIRANVQSQIADLWRAFRQRSILLPALFIFLYQATPNAGSAMFFFETNELKFTPEFMGRVTLIGQVAHLCGVGIYRFYLRSVPLKKVFSWCCILNTCIGMSQLILISRINQQFGLSDELFVLGDNAILQVLGQIALMPVLVLAARLCPEGVEATLFALLMSICNGGGITSGLLGAGLTNFLGVTDQDFSNLGLLVSICIFSNLLPLFFVALLPEDKSQDIKVK